MRTSALEIMDFGIQILIMPKNRVQQLSNQTDMCGNTGEVLHFKYMFFLFIFIPEYVMFGQWCVCKAAFHIIPKS